MPVIPSQSLGRARVGIRALAYTAYAAGEVNVDPRYPASRMAELRAFQRSTRGVVGATSVTFAIDFGADLELAALSFEHVNFSQMQVVTGTAADPGAADVVGETQEGSGLFDCAAIDPEDGRQKLLVVCETPQVCRYVFVTPQGTPASLNAFAIGSLGAWGADDFWTLFKNPGVPYRKVADDTYDGTTSPTRSVIAFPAKMERTNLVVVEQFLTLARVPRGRVILWDENEGDRTKWYHCRRTGVAETAREQGGYLDCSGFQLTEVGARDDHA